MQITLHLRRDEEGIQCQFGLATLHWGTIARWYEWGCRDLVCSDAPDTEGRGLHLRRDESPCVFLTDGGQPQVLLPIDGHPDLNALSELWIWPRVPFPVQRLASPATDTALPVLAG